MRTLFAVAALLLVSAPCAWAADPQPYTVDIARTGDAALDAAIADSVTLLSLRERAPVGPFALVARARSDAPRVVAALNSYGYYLGTTTIAVLAGDGVPRDLDDPALPAALDAGTGPVAVRVTPTAGALFHIGRVTLTGDVPADGPALLALPPGAPGRAADVLAARGRLNDALLAQGRALASVAAPVATLDVGARTLDVAYAVAAGPRVDVGQIAIGRASSGGTRLRESFIRGRLKLHPGDPFDPKALADARDDLAAVPAVGGVSIVPAKALDAAGRLPVAVEVSERKLRAVDLGAAFSTDQGGSLTASWTHRDLFGAAEQLTVSASATGLGGSASRAPGYDAQARLTTPETLGGTVTYDVQSIMDPLDAYDRTAALASVVYTRRLTPELSVNGGLAFEQARIRQEGTTRSYSLPQLPLGVAFDSTGSLFDPVRGAKASLSVTPTYSLGGTSIGTGRDGTLSRDPAFVIVQVSGSTYLDLGRWLGAAGGREVLALRALYGQISGAGVFGVPPDQRFYAGGGGTVRGYRYQSIGPRFADRRPVGGTRVEVGSVEYRQRIGESFGFVVFADAGEVTARDAAFVGGGTLQVGAGAGLSYYTSFGPIRVDVAVPLNRQRGQRTDALEAYIGLGQAF